MLLILLLLLEEVLERRRVLVLLLQAIEIAAGIGPAAREALQRRLRLTDEGLVVLVRFRRIAAGFAHHRIGIRVGIVYLSLSLSRTRTRTLWTVGNVSLLALLLRQIVVIIVVIIIVVVIVGGVVVAAASLAPLDRRLMVVNVVATATAGVVAVALGEGRVLGEGPLGERHLGAFPV